MDMEQTSVRVVAAADCGPDAVAIEFETPAEFEAAPGQFVRLTALVEDEEISRFYTISSADVEETFQITVGYDPVDGGPFSEYLLALEEGSQVEIAGPYGDTYHEGEPEVVILAGGPGIGPAVGIAERVLAQDGVAAVVYQDERPIHEARLEALEAAGVRVELVEAPTAVAGVVNDVLDAHAEAQLFVYGFAEFLDIAGEAIESAGGDFASAKVENFG